MSIEQSAAPAMSAPARETVREHLGAGPLELVISRIEDLTPRIRRYELRSPAGAPLPAWTPGAHISLPVPGAAGAETRCYSLMGDCEERDVYEIAVLRHDSGDGGSLTIHHDYHPGLRLQCAPPVNHFPLDPGTSPVLLIAGGIGITPIRSMAIALARRDADFVLHYATRAPAETALAGDLIRRFGDQVRIWHSATGRRLQLPELLAPFSRHGRVYVCGPARMIDAAFEAGERVGFPRANIRAERFVAAAPASSDHPFDVHLARSGRTIHVAADQSILDAVLASGVAAQFGCQAGVCGACAVGVVEGDVDHRDTVLSDEQRSVGRQACICVSRARGSRLVIEL